MATKTLINNQSLLVAHLRDAVNSDKDVLGCFINYYSAMYNFMSKNLVEEQFEACSFIKSDIDATNKYVKNLFKFGKEMRDNIEFVESEIKREFKI
jgi:hypothetical protein